MFGGLDLKGSASAAPASSLPPKNGDNESTPAPSSAFSFLMGNTTMPSTNSADQSDVAAASSQTATSSSAFSFLSSPPPTATMEANSGDAASMIPSPSDNNISSNSGISSFSFMSTSQVLTSSVGTDSTGTNELPPTVSSSFGFLQSVPPTTTDVNTEGYSVSAQTTNTSLVANSVDVTVGPPASASVFDFMSTTIPNVPTNPGTPVMVHKGTTGTAAPAGTGIVFGNAAVIPKAAVKKRTRTAKIGAAAQQMELPSPDPSPAAQTPPVAMTTTQNTVDVRDAALAASRRAEEFLRSKQEEAEAAASAAATKEASSMMNIRSVPSEEDDIIIAAKAAAKEAQKLSAKSHSSVGGGFSSLFRSRSTTKSPPDSVSFSSSAQQQPAVSLSTSSASLGSAEPTPMESSNRYQKDHDDAKPTVAEKEWHNLQQKRDDATSDNQGSNKDVPRNDYEISDTVDRSGSFVPPSIPTSGTRSLMSSFSKPTPTASLDVLTAPKVKTPTDIFNDMLHEFRQEVVKSMNEVTRLRQHRAGLLEERFVTNAKERLAVQQKKQAEIHQITAAENEDFDLADQMSATIDRYSREQAEYGAILENIGRAILELDRQKIQCVEKVTNCFVDLRGKLDAFQKEQESADTKNASEALAKFKTTSKQLSVEQERLQNDLKHIERDAELISDERKELEKAISEQSGEFEKLRDQARSRLTAVEEEIEELRKQLQRKQNEAAELRTEAAGHDESVLKVRVKFARQLTRLQKKEMTIKDNKEEWEAEKRSFETNKQLHEAQVRDHSEAMLARDSLLDALGKEIELSDTFASIVAKEIGFDVNAGNDEPECDNEMAQMQANVVKCEAAVSESKSALKTVITILKNLEDEIQGLEMQIPVLEDIKKRAAEKRDFKGASKASKEIKEATARLAECKEELDNEIISRKAAAESELAKLEEELDKARTVANEMERETGIATMNRLADNIKRLVATKQSVCGPSNGLSVSGVGAFVLEAQIKVLMMEGQAYGDKYGYWTDLIPDINMLPPDPPLPGEKTSSILSDKSTADAAIDRDDHIPVSETAEAASTAVNESISLDEKMNKFRSVSNRLKACEDQLEASVVAEDFEKAAELDEVLQQLLAEVQALNMTDEEMEAALTSDDSDKTPIADQIMDHEDSTTPTTDPIPQGNEDQETPESQGIIKDDSSPAVEDVQSPEIDPVHENGVLEAGKDSTVEPHLESQLDDSPGTHPKSEIEHDDDVKESEIVEG